MPILGTSTKTMTDQIGSKIIYLYVAYKDVGEGREQERKLCETQATLAPPSAIAPALLSTLAPASFYLVHPWTRTTYIPVGVLSLITYIPVGNSRAIACVPRLDLDYSESQLDSPRLMQRFLRIMPLICEQAPRVPSRSGIIAGTHGQEPLI